MNPYVEKLEKMSYTVTPCNEYDGCVIAQVKWSNIVIRYDTIYNEVTDITYRSYDVALDSDDLHTIIEDIEKQENILTYLGFRFSKNYRPVALAKAENALRIAKTTDYSYIAFGYVTAAHELLHWLSLNGYPCEDLHRQLDEAMNRVERMNR